MPSANMLKAQMRSVQRHFAGRSGSGRDHPFEHFPLNARLERRPARLRIRIAVDERHKLVHLRIERVEMVQNNGLGSHWQLRASEVMAAVVTQNHVLQTVWANEGVFLLQVS